MNNESQYTYIKKESLLVNGVVTTIIDQTSDEVPLVCVDMITYNHEKYIIQAIEGVLMQKTNFKYVLIIGEDCGTDKTRDIILEYQKKYPEKIILKLPEKNLGITHNTTSNMFLCESKYIAWCEGDDYWTDSLKLQKQVDFFEMNPNYTIHSSAAGIVNENNDAVIDIIGNNCDNQVFNLKDFYTQNNLIACTTMFRNTDFYYPNFLNKIVFLDWFLYVVLLKNSNSKAYKSKEVFSVYRIHQQSLMNSLSRVKTIDLHIQQINFIKKYIGYKKMYSQDFHNINSHLIRKFRITIAEKMFYKSLMTFLINFKLCGFNLPLRKYISALKFQISN